MKNSTIAKFSVWIILTIGVSNAILSMINASSSIANVLAILLTIAYITISIKTKCLTNFKFNKDEKSN